MLCLLLLYYIIDVLAGGTAVGYAGEWEQLMEYMKTSFFADSFGKVRLVRTNG